MIDKNEQTINDFLQTFKERAVDAHSRGNRFGGMYLAMIAGMWNHTLRRPEKSNLFESSDNDLFKSYYWGNEASAAAMSSNEQEMAIRKKIEENKAKLKKKVVAPVLKIPMSKDIPQDEKDSIWTKRLW